MRLTLRTMLAYLDDVLEPDDARELSQKIEESKFASELVHRVRNSMRQLRLGAPKLSAKGVGLDTNTVAEYLDNSLPAEQVPDFEKVCLESNMHLAEVASCHQILTIVLGEPAEVTSGIRDRVYRVGQAASDSPAPLRGAMTPPAEHADDDPEGDRASHGPGDADEPIASKKPPRKLEVPEYMRVNRKSRFRPIALGVVAVAGLVALGLASAGVNPLHWFRSAGGIQTLAGRPGVNDAAANSDDASGDATRSPDAGDEGSDGADREATTGAVGAPDPSVATDVDVSDDNTDGSDDNTVVPTGPEVGAGRPAQAASEESDGTSDPSPPTEGTSAESDQNSSDQNGSDQNTDDNSTQVADATPLDADSGDSPPVADVSTPMDVGRYSSHDDQVLIRWNADERIWKRVPLRAAVNSRDRLAVLPTFRPQITLTGGVLVGLAGASLLTPMPMDDQGVPGLALHRGRAVVYNDGTAQHVRLELGHRRGVLEFEDGNSEAAVEVRRFLPPGADPLTTQAADVTLIYAVSGGVRWIDEEAGAPTPVKPGQVRAYLSGEPGQTIEPVAVPQWVAGGHLTPIEERASRGMEQLLKMDRSILLSLKERVEDRQTEIRSLAARCLAFLGQYEALLDEFGDERQHAYWHAEFEALRRELAQGKPAAESMLRHLERKHGEELAISHYDLLVGFSDPQLAEKGGRTLVDLLDDERLGLRVLAFENLKMIMNKTFLYDPRGTSGVRGQYIRKWEAVVDQIRYVDPPTSLPQPRADQG